MLSGGDHFKLLITDMEMPGMDGAELAKQVKAKQPDLPMVMLSSIGDETKTKYPGLFSSILVKPVKLNHLCRGIQSAFNTNVNTGTEVSVHKVLSENFAQEHPLSILIAEDNLINQELITRIIR